MSENRLRKLSWLAEQTLAQAEKELFNIPRYVWTKEATSDLTEKGPFLVGAGVYLPSSGTKLMVV